MVEPVLGALGVEESEARVRGFLAGRSESSAGEGRAGARVAALICRRLGLDAADYWSYFASLSLGDATAEYRQLEALPIQDRERDVVERIGGLPEGAVMPEGGES